jgi:hypothetical protein
MHKTPQKCIKKRQKASKTSFKPIFGCFFPFASSEIARIILADFGPCLCGKKSASESKIPEIRAFWGLILEILMRKMKNLMGKWGY